MEKKNRKIGIMGGTFDPIHIGHLILGEAAYEQFELDEVWFLPAGNPPHKQEPGGTGKECTACRDGAPCHRIQSAFCALHQRDER